VNEQQQEEDAKKQRAEAAVLEVAMSISPAIEADLAVFADRLFQRVERCNPRDGSSKPWLAGGPKAPIVWFADDPDRNSQYPGTHCVVSWLERSFELKNWKLHGRREGDQLLEIRILFDRKSGSPSHVICEYGRVYDKFQDARRNHTRKQVSDCDDLEAEAHKLMAVLYESLYRSSNR
jgi:hypothetical protein